jgi:ElaB/YqjD/DUF883 family membrane-anchored ribosome-binding protein
MNEAIPAQSNAQPGNTRAASAAGPVLSTAAKAQQLSRTATERTQELRKTAVREQALREKLRRLENVAQEIDGGNRTLPAGETLASLSDANWDEIKQQLDSLHLEAERYIRDNPTKSVLTAAGVGFVLGLLMKR